MRIILIAVLLCLSHLATAQNSANYYQSIAFNTKSKIPKSTNAKQVTDEGIKNSKTNNIHSYNLKEWKKIKKQIRRSKRKYSNTKNLLYSSKIAIDTIFIDIHAYSKKPHLSNL